ncbi:hypothetical protein B0H66DRAFT_396732 [Apodospora peruviana]|uniref:Uncharacterized protein n=1 Tax=Apodospora peruviana TaxID=516989 RepID=A0AAE0HSY2_9PEZI|nr:hypothetical protein B0H66DRAFT_396732 [Apodospora peruviana]
MDASISSPPPPNNEGDHSLFGRLLRRAKSTKESSRSRRRRAATENVTDQIPTDGAEGATSNLAPVRAAQVPQHQHQRSQSSDAVAATATDSSFAQKQPLPQQTATIANPQQQSQPLSQQTPIAASPQRPQQLAPSCQDNAVPTPEMGTPTAVQQPHLRKKASLRDRLKAWQKPAPAPTPAPSEQAKPRFVYQPKHAASDFSRLVVSSAAAPRRARADSSDEDRTLTNPFEQSHVHDEEDAELAVKPRRHSPPLQTLVENETVLPSRNRSRREKYKESARASEEPSVQRLRSGAKQRHSYDLVEDPWDASHAAVVSVPIGSSAPVPSAAARRHADSQIEDPKAPLLLQQEEESQSPPPPTAERGSEKTAPMSDYERFIARAEAEERAYREKILRSFSQRSAALQQQQQHAGYVKPNPHLQYANVGGGELSGTTVVGGGRASGGGSKSSRGGSTQRTSGQYYTLAGSEDKPHHQPRGHKKNASWSPSGTDAEKALEKTSPPAAAANAVSTSRRPRQQLPVTYGVDEDYHPPTRGSMDYQPRTLRRQASITQRIAGYIKPTRELSTMSSNSEQTGYYPASSRTSSELRASRSQRQPKGIETLVE